jgi:hypothetical protein
MKRYTVKRFQYACLGLLLLSLLLIGCGQNAQAQPEKIRDLELTVVAEDKLPEALLEMVTQKKEAPFKFTFQDGDYLYLCIGYGEQESGGYSITVDDLYLTQNAIYVKTCLMGPSADVPRDGVKSYPYIVIKTEYLDYAVVFE